MSWWDSKKLGEKKEFVIKQELDWNKLSASTIKKLEDNHTVFLCYPFNKKQESYSHCKCNEQAPRSVSCHIELRNMQGDNNSVKNLSNCFNKKLRKFYRFSKSSSIHMTFPHTSLPKILPCIWILHVCNIYVTFTKFDHQRVNILGLLQLHAMLPSQSSGSLKKHYLILDNISQSIFHKLFVLKTLKTGFMKRATFSIFSSITRVRQLD